MTEAASTDALGTGTTGDERPRRFARGDVYSVLVLAALPLFIFVVPALVGHTVLLGDDFSQNYPLRAFVGSQIRHGHLPLFNPYIWSGAPLLSGWNAGAAYPLTLLFVILPATAAWTLNLVATWWVASLGSFFFLRASRLGALSGFLGALSFSFAGAMTAQVVHFGLVAGMSWVPIALVATLKLSEGASTRSRLGWSALLAVACGMGILAGEPRAIADFGVIVAVYAIWRVIRLGRSAGPFAAFLMGGVVIGLALGAIQWLPGTATVSTSQRASNSFYLFSSGSLPNRWLLLMLIPDILGGSGSFGQPSFLASYNITEVTGYVGLMPLVASFALLAKLRLRRPVPEWLIWQIMALLGVLLALGGNTPLWHVLIKIPFFGGQRLQSRNILIADMGFAFLLAYWADGWLTRARAEERRSRLLGSLPGVLAVAWVIVGFAWGAGLLNWLGVNLRSATHDGGLRWWFLPFGILGAGAVYLVAFGHRMQVRARATALLGFVVTDVIIFTLMTVVAFDTGLGAPSSAPSQPGTASVSAAGAISPGASVPTPPTTLSAASYAGNGRFAVYDPDLINTGGLNAIFAPDLNVVLAVPSVQGYSSIVDGRYASVTGSHQATGLGQDILDPKAVGDGTLDQLGTTVLFAPRDYFMVADSPTEIALPDPSAGRRQVAPGETATWFLGEDLAISTISVPDANASFDLRHGIRIGVVNARGVTSWASTAALADSGTLVVKFKNPESAVSLVVQSLGTRAALGAPTVSSTDGSVYVLDGQLEAAVVPPRWSLRGFDGSFAVFANRAPSPALRVKGSPGATVRALSGPAFAPASAEVSSSGGAEVIRSEAAIPGWSATWHPSKGPLVELPVKRSGLVQAVDVPAGTGVLDWTYDPPKWTAGWVVSTCGVVALAGMCLCAIRMRRRRTSTSAGT